MEGASAVTLDGTPVITVLVVSENRLHGEGLTLRLSAEPDLRALGPRASVTETLPLVATGEVDIVLVDVEPTAAHLRDLAAAVGSAPHVPYVALASADSEWEIVDWAEAGVYSIADRRGSPAELAAILQGVHRREAICSPRIAGTLLRCLRSLLREGRPPEGRSRLTHRERDVLSLMGDGMSNKEIADKLGLQVPTVKNHIHSIFEKLEVSSRAMAVSLALSIGELRRGSAG